MFCIKQQQKNIEWAPVLRVKMTYVRSEENDLIGMSWQGGYSISNNNSSQTWWAEKQVGEFQHQSSTPVSKKQDIFFLTENWSGLILSVIVPRQLIWFHWTLDWSFPGQHNSFQILCKLALAPNVQHKSSLRLSWAQTHWNWTDQKEQSLSFVPVLCRFLVCWWMW